MHQTKLVAILAAVLVTTTNHVQAQSLDDLKSKMDKGFVEMNEVRAKTIIEAWSKDSKMRQDFGKVPDTDVVTKVLIINGEVPLEAAKPTSELEKAKLLFGARALSPRVDPTDFAALLKKLKADCPGCDVTAPGTQPPGCPKK